MLVTFLLLWIKHHDQKHLKEECSFCLPFQRAEVHNIRDGMAFQQEAGWLLFHPHRKQRKSRNRDKAINFQTCPKWWTSSGKSAHCKGSITSPNSTINLELNIQMHEHMGDILHSKHHSRCTDNSTLNDTEIRTEVFYIVPFQVFFPNLKRNSK